MPPEFTNPSIPLENLPDYRTVALNSISIKERTRSLIGFSITFLVLVAGWAVFLIFGEELLWAVLAGGILLLFGLWRVFFIYKSFPCYGYALREKDILFKRGFLVSRTTVIPFNRIQHISTSESFLEKRLHIASIDVFTAGGSGSDISIPGLEPELAKRIKEAIIDKVKAIDD